MFAPFTRKILAGVQTKTARMLSGFLLEISYTDVYPPLTYCKCIFISGLVARNELS